MSELFDNIVSMVQRDLETAKRVSERLRMRQDEDIDADTPPDERLKGQDDN